jgi:hypothetical protein
MFQDRGAGNYYKISERYNGFVVYFNQLVPATGTTAAQGIYIYYRKSGNFQGWAVGDRILFPENLSKSRLYKNDGGYRTFARISTPNLEVSLG